MASTPSASALSAVLRCQGNILARKQANKKRPPAAVYGLGTTCGDSLKSSLWGFTFHRARVEIPEVLSVAVRFETGCSGKSSIRNVQSKELLVKSSANTNNMLTWKASSKPNQWPKSKLTPDNSFAFKSHRYRVLSRNNLVLRLDGTYLRKLSSDYPRTCICVVCAQNKSTLNYSHANPLIYFGLLWILRNKLIRFTIAVSDSVQKQLGIGWNQLHPDVSGRRCSFKRSHEVKPFFFFHLFFFACNSIHTGLSLHTFFNPNLIIGRLPSILFQLNPFFIYTATLIHKYVVHF